MHAWLDPINVKAMVAHITAILVAADPTNKKTYKHNSAELDRKLTILDQELKNLLRPLRNDPYIVFHDAYQYFEKRYSLSHVGTILVNPHEQLSAKRLKKFRSLILELGSVCVFSEPQFPSKVVDIITEGTRARVAVLDPLGVALEPGPNLYFDLINQLGNNFAQCLTQSS